MKLVHAVLRDGTPVVFDFDDIELVRKMGLRGVEVRMKSSHILEFPTEVYEEFIKRLGVT